MPGDLRFRPCWPPCALPRQTSAGSGSGGSCGVRERRHGREARVGIRLRVERGPASQPLAAIHPDGREAERLRGHVIVEEALGDVKDALAGAADALERQLEDARVGLVAPGLLCGDHVVERNAETTLRLRK